MHRLTNDELYDLVRFANDECELSARYLRGAVACAVAELRELRLTRISPDDIEALRYLKCFAEEAHEAAALMTGMEREHIAMTNRALAVLDRLLAIHDIAAPGTGKKWKAT